jgi:hypothetical protein
VVNYLLEKPKKKTIFVLLTAELNIIVDGLDPNAISLYSPLPQTHRTQNNKKWQFNNNKKLKRKGREKTRKNLRYQDFSGNHLRCYPLAN